MGILAAKMKRSVKQNEPMNAERAMESPYLNARRAWNDHVGGVVSERNTSRVLALSGMMLALIAFGALAYVATQSRFLPYIVEVDKLGRPLAVGFSERVSPTDPRIVRAAVASWVEDARVVSMDGVYQHKAIRRVYALVSMNDPAYVKLNEYFDPADGSTKFKRAQTELVSAEIETILPQSENTWQVEWIETTRDRQGAVKGKPQRWKALVNIYHAPPTTETSEDELRANPAGLFVRDFAWSKQG